MKEHNCIIGRRKKRSGKKRDSDDVDNVRNTHELLGRDTDNCEEWEEDDARDWQEKFLKIRKLKSNWRITPQKLKKRCDKNKNKGKKKRKNKNCPLMNIRVSMHIIVVTII